MCEKIKSTTFTQVQQYSDAKTIFLERERIFFVYIVSPFQSFYMESTCTAVHISPNKCSYARGKCLFKSFRGWGTYSNIY